MTYQEPTAAQQIIRTILAPFLVILALLSLLGMTGYWLGLSALTLTVMVSRFLIAHLDRARLNQWWSRSFTWSRSLGERDYSDARFLALSQYPLLGLVLALLIAVALRTETSVGFMLLGLAGLVAGTFKASQTIERIGGLRA